MPAPIFWRLTASRGIGEVIVLSAVLVPPRTRVLAPTREVIAPVRVSAPVPLALMYALAVVV